MYKIDSIMKKYLFLAAVLLCGTTVFTSCSKDEPEVTISIKETNYECKQGEKVTIAPVFGNTDETTTYTWTEGSEIIGRTNTLEYVAKVAGEHTVKCVVTNAAGSSEKVFTIKVAEVILTLDFESEKWTELVDSKQFMGDLLYGKNANGVVDYNWADISTKLSSKLTAAYGGEWGFAEGGIAISNYIDADIKGHNTSTYQLSVPKSNNSKNFAVVYCDATMSFSDMRARAINSIDISPTTFQLGVAKYGNNSAKALTSKGDYQVLVITGYDKNGNEVGKQEIDMARDGKFMEDWQTIVLNGAVNGRTYTFAPAVSYKFTMIGSDASSYGGINTPTYFAFDNVVVNMYAE